MAAPPPTSTDDVRKIASRFFSSADTQRVCLEYLADAIEHAHHVGPSRWGLTVRSPFIRLNVGKIEVLTITPDVFHLVVDGLQLPQRLYDDLMFSVRIGGGSALYASVAGSKACDFSDSSADIVLPLIREYHFSLIGRAADTPRHPMSKKSHTEIGLDYLRDYLGRQLPSPW